MIFFILKKLMFHKNSQMQMRYRFEENQNASSLISEHQFLQFPFHKKH